MSKIIIFSVLIAVAYGKHFGSPQNSTNGLCVFNSKNYNPGEEWYTSDCKKWKCVKGTKENEMILEGQSCDYQKIKHRSCEAKTIPGKKYPECCTNEIVCDGDRPSHDNARVVRSAGGGYDPYWAKVDQGWRDLDRQRAQAWQQYDQSWSQGGRPSTPGGVRVARSAGGGYDPYWAKVDQGWRDLDRQRAQAWQQYGQSWNQGGRPSTPGGVRVARSAGGGYDPYWAKVDQGWRELDRQRAQAWQQYDQSWSQGGRPSTPGGVRVRRSAGGGYDPYWAKVDQGWRDLDRQRAQAWQQYGQSWNQGGRPSTPGGVRVTRSAGGGYDPYWAKVDQGWKELDRARDQYWAAYGQSWGGNNRDRIRDDRDRIRDDRDRIRDDRDRRRH